MTLISPAFGLYSGRDAEIILFVLHREVSEDIGSIKQFSSELIVEAVVRCIQVIDPSVGATLPMSLPPGMSARFRVGMSLAQACQVGTTCSKLLLLMLMLMVRSEVL